jgi:hypothetical protein
MIMWTMRRSLKVNQLSEATNNNDNLKGAQA